MRAIICGANGAMGVLARKSFGDRVCGLVSLDGENGVPRTFRELGNVNADVIVDFSHHSAVADILAYAKAYGCSVILCATGHTEDEKALIQEAARELPIFYSGNMSLGIAVLSDLVRQAVRSFPEADVEILEVHHNRKVDAPSGTAHMLFSAVQEARPQATAHCGRSGEGKRTPREVGISSLRMGNVVGIHEVHICTPSQALTLRHEAHDRAMFADGAVRAAEFMEGKPAGLYAMRDLLKG